MKQFSIIAQSILVLLFSGFVAEAQTITVPLTVQTQPGQFVVVKATTDSKVVKWFAVDQGLSLFPSDLLKDSTSAVVIGLTPGSYRLLAYTAIGDVPSDPAICTVIIGGVPPSPIPPSPDPKPPTPPIPPAPPAPIPGQGLRVAVIYETATLGSLPKSQWNILYANDLRTYLASKTAKGPSGQPEYRILDKDVQNYKEGAKIWMDVLQRPRGPLPWIVISNGQSGYEGPLPMNVDDTIKLVKQYE